MRVIELQNAGQNNLTQRIPSGPTKWALRALDMALLNSPQFTIGRNSLFRQIRYNSTVPGDIRELSILRIGTIQGAAYEWQQHEPLQLIRNPSFSPYGEVASSVFTPKQIAALKFTDTSTRNSHVHDDTWSVLKEQFPDPQQITELVLTVAAYNLVSRFLLAANVGGVAEAQVPYPE
ncbi:4-carboxymuconolactone decarboxylase family protein [Rhizoctonia solani]|nr:4-carboxymuconolactone decarboxylase family protein [Rhizoctonia solani]